MKATRLGLFFLVFLFLSTNTISREESFKLGSYRECVNVADMLIVISAFKKQNLDDSEIRAALPDIYTYNDNAGPLIEKLFFKAKQQVVEGKTPRDITKEFLESCYENDGDLSKYFGVSI